MSKSSRIDLRNRYMEGWYRLDIDLLLRSTAADFVFDDPAEPEPVTRDALPAYMRRWQERMRAAGGDNEWRLEHCSRQDRDGLLTDWEWWQVLGTGFQGAAVVLTGDTGVLLERITYFDRDLRHRMPAGT